MPLSTKRAEFELRPVDLHNRGDLQRLDLGDAELWLKPRWYWHQQSIQDPFVHFHLIHIPGAHQAVGSVAVGPAYVDENHCVAHLGDYQLLELALDRRWQGRGLGAAVAIQVFQQLAQLEDCRRIVLSIHPENQRAQHFFERLGFIRIAQEQDGDALWAIATGQDLGL